MRTLVYKSDAGNRKGLHHVNIVTEKRGKRIEDHYFSVDEPGAWFEDKWNCHVDGCDYPCSSREEAIQIGADVLYDGAIHKEREIEVIYEC